MEYDYEVQSKYIGILALAWYVAHDNFEIAYRRNVPVFSIYGV